MNYIDLYWLPVGAGTHFQRTSLLLYESVAAAMSRRSRSTLCHAALKIGTDAHTRTLELMPVPPRQDVAPLLTGAVGSELAGRLRLLRYQVCLKECERLPDEEWAATTVRELFAIAPSIPNHVWGRRLRGTDEMWTSNSAVAWLLTRVGLPAADIRLPAGTRAPGWDIGIRVAAGVTPARPAGRAHVLE